MSEARALLDLRLAKGEISLDQYQTLVSAIGEAPRSQSVVEPLPLVPLSQEPPASSTRWWKGAKWAIGVVIAIGVLRLIFGGPVCNLSNLNAVADAFMVNGQLDAGFTTAVDVTNNGGSRNLVLSALLTTSEGDFRRAQTLYFEDGQTRRVTFQFPEPTITATGIKTYVTCSL